jgi:hypothetical protein
LKNREELLLLGAEYRSPSNRMIQFSMDYVRLIGFVFSFELFAVSLP